MTDASHPEDDVLAGMPGRPPVGARTLADLVNRVLDRGVVVGGDVTISVAGVDLVFLRLSALLTSVATAQEKLNARGGRWVGDQPAGRFLGEGESAAIESAADPKEHQSGDTTRSRAVQIRRKGASQQRLW